MSENLIPIMRKLSEGFSNYELSYVRSDIEQDIRNLRNAAAFKQRVVLFMTHRCGSWLAPLDVTLTWNTFPHAAFRNEHYVATAKFYVLQLDTVRNYDAPRDVVYGTVRKIDGKDVAALVSAYTVTYDEAVVTLVEDGAVMQRQLPRQIADMFSGPDVKEVRPVIDQEALKTAVTTVEAKLLALSTPMRVLGKAG